MAILNLTTSTSGVTNLRGKGVLVALLLLLGVEIYLHSDDFLHRYRSVFAVGRAADKITHVNTVQPRIVFLGNSRVDNGISPREIASTLNLHAQDVFNLGLPGQNTRVLLGVVQELESALSGSQLQCIMVGLDASLFYQEDSLNYSVFLADRKQMFDAGEYRDLASSLFRLWGYSPNLKGLRDPARFNDFVAATISDQEPWGGSVIENSGFRAKPGKLTSSEANWEPEQGPPHALKEGEVAYFLAAIDRLLAQGKKVGVFFTPQYKLSNEFEWEGPGHETYTQLLENLKSLGVDLFHIESARTYGANKFANLGHLNESGARIYSESLAKDMQGWCSDMGAQS